MVCGFLGIEKDVELVYRTQRRPQRYVSSQELAVVWSHVVNSHTRCTVTLVS